MFRFGIKNLRRLEHVPLLELRPITVLVGRNSSGKSTFLRALPLLRQSITTRTSSPILWYGDWVDFGNFDGAIIDNQANSSISFLFGVENIVEDREYYTDEVGIYTPSQRGSPLTLEAEIQIAKHQLGTKIISINLHEKDNGVKYDIIVGEDNKVTGIAVDGTDLTNILGDAELLLTAGSILPTLLSTIIRERKSTGGSMRSIYRLELIVRRKLSEMLANRLDKRIKPETLSLLIRHLLRLDKVTKQNIFRIGSNSENKSWGKLLEEICTTDKNQIFPQVRQLILLAKLQDYLSAFSQHVREIISSTLYIGPARAKSDRYYRYQDLAVSEIDPDGKNFPMFLNSLTPLEMASFSQWVKTYFKYGVSIVRESGHISIKLDHESSAVNIVDTGYGVSQILPVLGQVWWATNRRRFIRSRERMNAPIIAIEQPELHLHPAHQAMLADAFVSSLDTTAPFARERSAPSFVIETHSEALINRLGTLVAEQKISPESVQILVFETDAEINRRTTVRIIPFDNDGQLIDWPYGFFSPAAS